MGARSEGMAHTNASDSLSGETEHEDVEFSNDDYAGAERTGFATAWPPRIRGEAYDVAAYMAEDPIRRLPELARELYDLLPPPTRH